MSLLGALLPKRRHLAEWLTARRLRVWRENLTAYLMIAPATILIFVFGIFPVGFAVFVSLHKWRLKRGDIIGLTNYTSAIGSLAYPSDFKNSAVSCVASCSTEEMMMRTWLMYREMIFFREQE